MHLKFLMVRSPALQVPRPALQVPTARTTPPSSKVPAGNGGTHDLVAIAGWLYRWGAGPTGSHWCGRRKNHARRAGDHAGDRRANDHRNIWLRLVVSRDQYQGTLLARLDLFRPPRACCLGDTPPDHHVSRWPDLGWRARPGSLRTHCRGHSSSDQRTDNPVEVQVVSLDWKWLFIYPDRHIASVNELVLPAGTPVHFLLTSATVMNIFSCRSLAR